MEPLRQLLSQADDGVCGVDDRQTVVFWNDAAERMLGHTFDEVRGRYCYDVFRGRDHDGCAFCREDCLVQRGARQYHPVGTCTIQAETKGGQPAWIEVTTLVMPVALRNFALLFHLFRSADHQIEAETALRELLALSQRSASPEGREAISATHLTTREREVLFHLVSGHSTQQIADTLFISPATVRNHVKHVLAKLGAHSRVEAVSLAVRHQLV